MSEKEINILGVSVTWLDNKNAKFIYKHFLSS